MVSFFYLFSCLISLIYSTPIDNKWSVVNGKLMYNGEQNVRVQGVSLSCTEFDSPIDMNGDGTYVCPLISNGQPTSHLIELSQTWNAQIVRIPINSQWYMWDIETPYPSAPNGCQFASLWSGQSTYYGNWTPSAYRQWIDDHVKGINSLGMIALIDLHWSDMDGTACCDNGNGGCYDGCQQTMADQKSLYFWNYVATKYANQSDIWFELYNEPAWGLDISDISALINGESTSSIPYMNGCPASSLSSFTFVGMQDLYNVIRFNASADNIVVVGGNSWSWSLFGLLVPPATAAPGVSWCSNQPCQQGCGITVGIDNMIQQSPRLEGYPAPVSWSNHIWGKNIIYNSHPYQAKGGQTPTEGEPCGNWVGEAINGTTTYLCTEQCGWENAFGYLTKYVPVIATELGPWEGFACDGAYISCQLEWFASEGISFTAWAYWGNPNAACNSYPTLVYSNWTLNGYGESVFEFMTESSPPYLLNGGSGGPLISTSSGSSSGSSSTAGTPKTSFSTSGCTKNFKGDKILISLTLVFLNIWFIET